MSYSVEITRSGSSSWVFVLAVSAMIIMFATVYLIAVSDHQQAMRRGNASCPKGYRMAYVIEVAGPVERPVGSKADRVYQFACFIPAEAKP